MQINRAADLVRKNLGSWNGSNYSTLLPAAKLLEISAPLEASILYRALIDYILSRAKSSNYHYVIKYLAKLQTLDSKILNYAPVLSHTDYMALILKEHRLKRSLWALVGEIP
jgi:hypothetical protein